MLTPDSKLLNFRGLPACLVGTENWLVSYECPSELANVMAIAGNVKSFLGLSI